MTDATDRPSAAAHVATRRRPRGLVRVVSQAAVILTLVGVTSAFALLHKDIVLDVDGEIRQVSAYGHTVADVLDYRGVEVGADDIVAPAPDEAARDGATIVVRTSHDVTIEVDGRTETFPTTARTVGELLAALGPRGEGAIADVSRSQALGRDPVRISTLKTVRVAVDGAVLPITTAEPTVRGVLTTAGIVLNEGDETSAPLNAAAVDGMLVLVSRAATTSATVTEVLPFETEESQDPTLPRGQRVVVTTGQVGRATTTYAVETVGGVEVSRTVLTRSVSKEPRTEVVRIGTMDVVAVPVDPGSARAIAKGLAAERGWGEDQFACLDKLWEKESHWNVSAQNRSSGAYGIPQALPGSKMSKAGSDWRTNPRTQIVWGLGYIEGRYGTPCGAWSHSVSKGWY